MTFENKLHFKEKKHLHNVSIHRKFYQNRFIHKFCLSIFFKKNVRSIDHKYISPFPHTLIRNKKAVHTVYMYTVVQDDPKKRP